MTYITQKELADYRQKHQPESCPILGTQDYAPVVDHDHQTGNIRGVISREANSLVGKIENFYRSRCAGSPNTIIEALRNIANYLEQEQGPLHPVGKRQLVKRFSRKSKEEQNLILEQLNASQDEINQCKNSKERTKLYDKALKLWHAATNQQ